jgi:hypothetical protein
LRSDREEQIPEVASEGTLLNVAVLAHTKLIGLQLLTRSSIRWLLNTVFSAGGGLYRIVVLMF